MKRPTARQRPVCPCAGRHYSCLPNCRRESKGLSERQAGHERERDRERERERGKHLMLSRCSERKGKESVFHTVLVLIRLTTDGGAALCVLSRPVRCGTEFLGSVCASF